MGERGHTVGQRLVAKREHCKDRGKREAGEVHARTHVCLCVCMSVEGELRGCLALYSVS